ncbi:MAG TPA: glycosyltransferase, partial [Bryobacteraceae bacterium]|nr:glycosyltransferase [Bryobacteraceae bacterium]
MVVIALNEGEYLRSTVENLQATLPADAEILVVDDGSEDGSTEFLKTAGTRVRMARAGGLGVARARNWGARQTTGEVLVFADAHITLPHGWLPPLLDALTQSRVGAVAPAIFDVSTTGTKGFGLYLTGPDLHARWLPRSGQCPHPAPILPGCCLAMRRDVFDATGGFDAGLLSRGGVDNELGIRFWLLGYELLVVPSVSVGHLFRPRSPYEVKWTTYLHNALRLAFVHLSQARIDKVMRALAA